jgi:hypothetical protein
VREQRVVLEHDAGAALVGRQRVDRLPFDQHVAFALAQQAGDDPQQRGLAATRRTEQRHQLAGHDGQRHVVHRQRAAVAVCDALERQRRAGARARRGAGQGAALQVSLHGDRGFMG